jgi:hypothetical protein
MTMTSPEKHLEIEDLVDYARGALSRKRRRAVEAHCETCPRCNLDLAKTLVLRTRHRQQMRRRSRHRRLLAAASVVLLLGAAGIVLLGGRFTDRSTRLAELTTDETISPSHLGLRFGAGLPASTDLGEYQLKQGMDALVAGDYPTAVEVLGDLLPRRRSDTEVAAYLGIAMYLAHEDPEATRALLALGTTDSRPPVSRAATWYLANFYLREGDAERATALLEDLDLGELSDRYSRYASDLLEQVERIQSK